MKAIVIIRAPPQPAAASLRDVWDRLIADLRALRKARAAGMPLTQPLQPEQLWTWFLPNPISAHDHDDQS